jgi:ribonucleoside-diphosphate reductase alpha chain
MGRLISLALRSGIPIREVHRQLRGIASDKAIGLGPNKVLSVPDAIGIALEKWMREKQGVQQDLLGAPPPAPSSVEVVQQKPTPVTSEAGQAQYGFDALNRGESFIGTCPDCGSSLEMAEGCAKCHVCGFSECG